MAATEAKKHIKEITAEYLPFWEPLFENMGIVKPWFYAKLGYNGGEFGTPKVECVRFWPSELDSGEDLYVELFNWDQNYYHGEKRTLYRLIGNKNWEKETSKYAKVESSSLSTATYAVRISDLEIVNTSSAKNIKAETVSIATTGAGITSSKFSSVSINSEAVGIVNTEFDPAFDETDANMSKMTMKDHYCITHNVPMSDKHWLNQLILNSRAWQQKQNQK